VGRGQAGGLHPTTLKIVNHGPGNDVFTITGEGKILLRPGPDLEDPDWYVTTGQENQDQKGKVTWSAVSVATKKACQVILQSSPATEFEYLLKVSRPPDVRFSLHVFPGLDMHDITLKCPHPTLGWVTYPYKLPHLFAAAWTTLHASMGGAGQLQMPATPGAPPPGGLDLAKIASMDPRAIEAMAEGLKSNPTPANAGQLANLMNQLVPSAGQLATAAQDNFKFAIPDNNWCKVGAGTALLGRCEISRTLGPVPDNKGSTQTITETTTITIGRPKA